MVTWVKRPGSGRIIVGVSLVSLTLGLLLAAYQLTGFRVPEFVYFLLVGVGTIGGATVNGYRDGGVAVSCVAAGIGVFPMALAFAPSGPPEIHLTTVDIIVKAGGATLFIGLTVGSLSHGIGLVARRLQSE